MVLLNQRSESFNVSKITEQLVRILRNYRKNENKILEGRPSRRL